MSETSEIHVIHTTTIKGKCYYSEVKEEETRRSRTYIVHLALEVQSQAWVILKFQAEKQQKRDT